MFFTKHIDFFCFLLKFDPKVGLRSTQDGSKIILDRFLDLFHFRFVFLSFSARCSTRFGFPNGAQGAPLSCANRPWERSKTVSGSSWFGSFYEVLFGFAIFTLLGSSCGRLGSLLAPFWAVLGPFWGSLGGILEPSTSLLSPLSSCSLLSALFPLPSEL